MELRHEFTVPASLDTTWEAFGDITSVAECFPGAQVTSVEGDDFKGTCKVKLGPIALTYSGSGSFKEKDESAHRFVVEAKGKDKRGNGTAGATVTASFTGDDSSTTVEVLTDLAITGKPAQFGRGVMQDVSDKLLTQFVDCLATKVSSGAEGDAAAAPAADDAAAGGAAEQGDAAGSVDAGGGEPGGDSVAERAEAARPPGPAQPTPVAETAGPAGAASERTTVTSISDAPSSASSAATAAPSSGGGGDDALDLGATVLPVLAKAYWKQALGAVLVLLVLRRLLSRG